MGYFLFAYVKLSGKLLLCGAIPESWRMSVSFLTSAFLSLWGMSVILVTAVFGGFDQMGTLISGIGLSEKGYKYL